MKYRPEIDGLRAIAVIPIILFHAGLSVLGGGFVGVDIFFVISGYLIASILLAEIQNKEFSLLFFYERRIRRILPILFFVIFFTSIGAWIFLLPEDMKAFSKSLVAVVSFSSNILFMRESGYWDISNELIPLLHTWSLAVEEQFYFIFPLLLMFFWKGSRSWISGLIVSLVFVISLSLAHWGSYQLPVPTFYLLTSRAWELMIGVGIAYYFFSTKGSRRRLLSNVKANELASLVGLGMIAYAILIFDKDTPFPSLYALVPTLGAGLIILFSNSKTYVGRMLSTKLFVGVGLISYGAYLWHQPLLAFTRYNEIATGNNLNHIIVALLSIPLAFVTWKLVEIPCRKRTFYSRKIIFISSFLISGIFVFVGLAGYVTNGFPDRFESNVLSLYYTNNGSLEKCDEDTLRKNGSTCIIGDQNEAPTSVLLGDSHSSKLTKSLDEILKNNNKSMVVYAQAWCPPLIDFGTDNINKTPVCREYMTSSFNKVLESNEIKLVILSAEWANYTKGIRPGTDREQAFYTDEKSLNKSLKENHDAFTRSVDRTITSLFDKKKKIVFITSVPEYGIDVPVVLTKLRLSGKKELPQQLRVSNTDYKKRNKEVINTLLETKVSEHAVIIDVFNIFCKDKYCDYLEEEQSLYEDSNHLTYEATKRITKKIEPYIIFWH